MLRAVASAAAVLFTLSACAIETSSEEPAEDESITSPADLKDAAGAAGYECPSWGEENSTLKGGTKSIVCTLEDGSEEGFLVFTGDFKQAYLDRMKEHFREFPSDRKPLLVGPNWVITGAHAAELQKALGGKLID